ncbi:MAG TPA: transcription termination/antitermination protein NusG, partial [Pirellulales bacterium]|nr:transcription termination/antitermination protein NusG [Pirellulales bacterium]
LGLAVPVGTAVFERDWRMIRSTGVADDLDNSTDPAAPYGGTESNDALPAHQPAPAHGEVTVTHVTEPEIAESDLADEQMEREAEEVVAASLPPDDAASPAGAAAEPHAAPRTERAPAARAPVEKGPLELIETQAGPTGERQWYILKVQSNREDSIRDALERKIAIAGLKDYFGDIIVPVEMVTEFKNGKKRVVRRKLYPGYIVVNMELNDDTWYLVRDTHGIGDFTGPSGKPQPMPAGEISKIVTKQEEKADEAPKLKIKFNAGDRVKITEGTFENFEGDVESIDQTNGRVTVMINIFGRSTPVELEYWQIESV